MKTDDVKNLVLEDMERIKKMSVEEYTLYRKWDEISNSKWSKRQLNNMWKMKQMIWKQENLNEYQDIEPIIVPGDDNKLELWNTFRTCIATSPWHQNPGRFARFFVMDNKTKKYLGIISVASDFISMKGRDDYIGWTLEDRQDHNMLQHTMVASTIMPTQPFGYNYTGGKLITLLVASDTIVNYWENKYPEKLIGITTTSLYGTYSQYTHLKHWRKCESTSGNNPFELSDSVYKIARKWLVKNHPEMMKEIVYAPTRSKEKTKKAILKMLGLKSFSSNFKRGVFFCPLYDNFKDFLTKRSTDTGNKKFDNSVKALSELWKEKYATKRFNKLLADNRLSDTSFFHSDLIGKTWDEAKRMYLHEVGR